MKIWGCKPEERIKEGSRLARALRRSIHHWIRRWNANCNGGAGCSSTNDRLDTVGSYWEIIVAVGSFFSSVCISHVFRVFFFFFQKYRREIKKLREKKEKRKLWFWIWINAGNVKGTGFGFIYGDWHCEERDQLQMPGNGYSDQKLLPFCLVFLLFFLQTNSMSNG